MVSVCPHCMNAIEKPTETSYDDYVNDHKDEKILGLWSVFWYVTTDDLDDRKYFQLDAIRTHTVLDVIAMGEYLSLRPTKINGDEIKRHL